MNPSSTYSVPADDLLFLSRNLAASAIGADVYQIVFTSSGSESNNLAVHCNPTELWISAVEHHSLLMIPHDREIPVDSNGIIDEECLKEVPKGALVCIQMVNNETGVFQDIEHLAKIVHDRGAYIHCDAVQGFPHLSIDVKKLGIDSLSISGHKFGCAAGVGVLYVKDPSRLIPLIYNTQERGLRGGTENIPYIAAMANRMVKVAEENAKDNAQLKYMEFENYIYNELVRSKIPFLANGVQICYSILSLSFKGVNGVQLAQVLADQDVFVSTGSACASKLSEPSHVLKAMNISEDYINGSIRISFSSETTMTEVKKATKILITILKYLTR